MSISVNIKKKIGNFQMNVNFSTEGEILALLGASGCGKSMTLKCIAGIVTPDEGRIVLNGRVLFDSGEGIDLSPQQRRVGYLFQQYALFPNMTVEQNIIAGIREGSREERRALAAREMERFQITALKGKRPHQLSGGEQQRVALARIWLNRPEILLLDEPFSALDSYLRWQLELELQDLLQDFGKDILFVSHSRDEVYRLCDCVCVLNKGISEAKTSVDALFSAPQTVSAATLSGCKNISRAEAVDESHVRCPDWGVTLKTAAPPSPDTAFVGLRAHYLAPGATEIENTLSCRVERVVEDVFSTIVMLTSPGGGQLRMELEKSRWEALGNPKALIVSIAPEHVMLLH